MTEAEIKQKLNEYFNIFTIKKLSDNELNSLSEFEKSKHIIVYMSIKTNRLWCEHSIKYFDKIENFDYEESFNNLDDFIEYNQINKFHK